MSSDSWPARLVFYMISITALLGNALVLWVFIRKRNKSTKTPFDLFIINLAASDFLAAIFILFSRFLFNPSLPESQSGAFGYCSIIWGGFILFGLGYVSVYTCLVLTIERWLAVIKPHLYRRLTRTHAIWTIVVVWLWAFLINSTVFFSVKADLRRNKCQWVDPKTGRAFFAFVEISMSSVLPFSLIIIMYAHVYYRVRQMRTRIKDSGGMFKRRLTIIALVASMALIIGWLPVKISFMLRYTSVGGKHLQGTAHLIFIMMALGNSCVNPILYGIYSSKFRGEYKKVLRVIFCQKCAEEEIDTVEDTSDIDTR